MVRILAALFNLQLLHEIHSTLFFFFILAASEAGRSTGPRGRTQATAVTQATMPDPYLRGPRELPNSTRLF